MTHEEIHLDVVSGELDPLLGLAMIKQLAKEVKYSQDIIEVLAQDEAAKYEKTFDLHGFTFTKKVGGRMYDFKHIEEWQIADDNKKEIEAKYKAVAAQYERGITGVEDTGEVLESPVVTYRKDSISVKPVKS